MRRLVIYIACIFFGYVVASLAFAARYNRMERKLQAAIVGVGYLGDTIAEVGLWPAGRPSVEKLINALLAK